MTAVLHTSAVLAPLPPSFDDDVAISIVTFAELHFGVMAAQDQAARGERLRRLSALQSQFEPLPVDGSVAAAYGRLAAAVAESGRTPRTRVMDLLIAATAVAHGARLVTRNESDLAGLEDLVEIVAF
jgi:predicted nucleic acid-binding protein